MIGQVRYGALDLTKYPYILDPQTNFGAPTAESATVSRLLADGDVVAGVRSGNRTLEIPVSIGCNSRPEFAAAEVALFAEVNRAMNTLTVLFGAGDGLPVVADTYRGQLIPTYDADIDYDYVRSYVITCPAEPFFRSPDPITIAGASASTLLFDFDSLTGLTTSETATVDTTTFVTSTGSVRQPVTVDASGKVPLLSASWASALSSTDLSADRYVVLWLLSDYPHTVQIGENAQLTLTSAGGAASTYVGRTPVYSPGWTPVTWDLAYPSSSLGGGVDLAAVTGWEVTLGPVYSWAGSGPWTVWADDLRAYPHGSAEVTAGSANLFFSNIEGAARTPISLELDTNGSGGILLANTPNPPPGYDPVLQAVTGTPPAPVVVTRKTVTLRREAPECSTYIVVVYGPVAGDTWTATAVDAKGTSTCSRTMTTSDPEYRNRNSAGHNLFAIGELTLPPTDVDPQNTAATITITISSGQPIKGAWLVWAGGENVLAMSASAPAKWFLDAVTPGRQGGKLLGGSARSDAYDVSAGRYGQAAVNFPPGPNHLLAVALPPAATPSTNPTLTAALSYFSRWLTERTS